MPLGRWRKVTDLGQRLLSLMVCPAEWLITVGEIAVLLLGPLGGGFLGFAVAAVRNQLANLLLSFLGLIDVDDHSRIAVLTQVDFWYFGITIVARNVLPAFTFFAEDGVTIVIAVFAYTFYRVFLLFCYVVR